MENTQISTINKSLDATIAQFERIKELAIYLSTSDAFTQGFELKNEKGEVLRDENGRPRINVADVAICLMTGHEVGLDIGGSLLYGKKLNQSTYMSIIKGRSMGIDLATSIEKIVTITGKSGNPVTYTMVDLISAKLIEAGVEYLPFIKNYAPFYIYTNARTKEELELDKICDEQDDLKDEYYLVYGGNQKKEDIDAAEAAGKTLVTRVQHGYYSKAKFVRKFPDNHILTHIQRFSTLDAERAELLPIYGIDPTNNLPVIVSKGKDNWIKATPQMMANRVISIAGRIICADQLKGVYTREEVISAGLVSEKDAPIVEDIEAQVIK
jgi:hypothetical protein